MPAILVCPLSRVSEFVATHRPGRLVTLLDPSSMIDTPAPLLADHHLKLGVNDIAAPAEGMVAPGQTHVDALLNFIESWDPTAPMLIHCWAGVSRSTASAFIAACHLNPGTAEDEIATEIRVQSPTASPNPALIALADATLGRSGRMVRAIKAIGRGEDCFEGVPLSLPARWAA